MYTSHVPDFNNAPLGKTTLPEGQSEQALNSVWPVRFPYFPAGQSTVEVAFGQYDPFEQSEHCDVPFSKAMVPVLQSEQALNPVRFPNFPAGQAVASPPVPIQ